MILHGSISQLNHLLLSVLLPRKKGFQRACGGSPLLLRRAANWCFFVGYLVSLGKFLSNLQTLSPLLKYICFFTPQKTFPQPAQNRGCPKQLHFILFHTDVISKAFCSTSGEHLEPPGLQVLLKISSSSLGWCSRLFSVSVTSYFPTLISIVKVPADFICHDL